MTDHQPLKLSKRSVGVLFDAAMKLADISNTISTILAHEKAMNNQPAAAKAESTPKPKAKGGKKGGKRTATPMGEAAAPEAAPVNGTVYSRETLETKNRRDLAKIARDLGLDSKGVKAADLRAEIVKAQGDDEDISGQTFSEDCVVTGDTAVGHADTEGGETHPVSQAVIDAIKDGAMLDDFLSGDDEVANYA